MEPTPEAVLLSPAYSWGAAILPSSIGSMPRLVEISDIQCGKHRALAFLADYLGIPQEKVCAFGNADNDADMLLWAGTGIAVANSSPACLRAADVVTAHYLEDGVAQALKKCFGICAE